MLKQLRKDLRDLATPKKAKAAAWFFKTEKGHYGYGDKFLGVTVPEQRIIATKYKNLTFANIKKLLQSEYHEERLIGLLILDHLFYISDEKIRKIIYSFFISHIRHVNNWDLVDLSAPNIVGRHLLKKPRAILYKLALSKNLWERRIAIVSTYTFIRNYEFNDTLQISKILLKDKEDLMHKAVGWMLREVGKKDEKVLIKFLNKYYKHMPRTALRYSLERLPDKLKSYYMKK